MKIVGRNFFRLAVHAKFKLAKDRFLPGVPISSKQPGNRL